MKTQPETDKYYVPEIEEFHTGFEFELWDYGYQTFMPKKFTFEYCNAIAFATSHFSAGEGVPEKTIRVRYLSHEDIVGEGWILSDEILKSSWELKIKNGRNADVFRITHASEQLYGPNKYSIQMRQQSNWFDLYSGTIRNRSELKMIIKMLGIK